MRTTQEQFRERLEAHGKKGFEDFMRNPAITLMMSLVPPCEPPELLSTLLRAAYDTGLNVGEAGVSTQMLEMIFQKEEGK